MKASFVTILLTTLLSQTAFGHGMNKPGPHGGYIRMPGNYHIELVDSGKSFKIHFLDMMFAPISIQDAKVTLSLKGEKTLKVECMKEVDAFNCKNIPALKNYKEVVIESSRDSKAHAVSIYKLPLSFN